MRKSIFKKSIASICLVLLAFVILTGCKREEMDYSTLKYATFGDSITYGGLGNGRGRMEKPYATLVEETLGLAGSYNLAVSGASYVYGIKGRTCIYTQIENFEETPDIISVMGGVNDFTSSATLGKLGDTELYTIYGSVDKCIVTLQEKFPNAFIFFMTPLKNLRKTDNNSAGVHMTDVAEAIKAVCKSHDVPVLDMYMLCDFSLKNDPETDRIHPSQEFTRDYMAPLISEFIKDNYKKKA